MIFVFQLKKKRRFRGDDGWILHIKSSSRLTEMNLHGLNLTLTNTLDQHMISFARAKSSTKNENITQLVVHLTPLLRWLCLFIPQHDHCYSSDSVQMHKLSKKQFSFPYVWDSMLLDHSAQLVQLMICVFGCFDNSLDFLSKY